MGFFQVGSPLKIKFCAIIHFNYLTIPFIFRFLSTHIVPVDTTFVKLSKINNVLYNECSLWGFFIG